MKRNELKTTDLVAGKWLVCWNVSCYKEYLTVGKLYKIHSVGQQYHFPTEDNRDPLVRIIDNDNDPTHTLDINHSTMNGHGRGMFTALDAHTEEEQFLIRLGGVDSL